jgi:thiamine-phosphate pyrophosphorylase
MHKFLPKLFVFIDKYDSEIFKNININIGVIYRNYNSKKRENELIKVAKACKINRNQLFISNDIKLVIKFKAEGIYIPSFNKTNYFGNLEKKNIKIVGSAHNQKEISKKISQKCTAIFLSPIFFVQKSKTFLGLHKFNYISYRNNINLLALGGISKKNVHKLKLLNTKGYGGISIFQKKTGL